MWHVKKAIELYYVRRATTLSKYSLNSQFTNWHNLFHIFFSIRNLVSDFNGIGRVKSQTIKLHTIFQELQYLIKFFPVSIEDKINESHSTLQIHLCVASLYSIPFWILTAFDLF